MHFSRLPRELILNLTFHDSWLIAAQLTSRLSALCAGDTRERSNNMYVRRLSGRLDGVRRMGQMKEERVNRSVI